MLVKKYALVVTAHPDDESLYFSGLLMNQNKTPWKIICVTDGGADRRSSQRSADFARAISLLKVDSYEQWNFKDQFEKRLPIEQLVDRLKQSDLNPTEVYTHGILGEYGHPHHQDVSVAVHRAFKSNIPIWSAAYNAYSEKTIQLSPKQYKLKAKILTEVYKSETRRFLNFLPITSAEYFIRVEKKEVEHLYAYFAKKEKLSMKKLKTYKHLYEFLKEKKQMLEQRPF